MRYSDLIERRKSIREFQKRELDKMHIQEIEAYFPRAQRLIADISVELRICTGNTKNRLEGVAGYQGYAFGAPAYLVILSEKAEYAEENAGFLGEDLILKLTELGIDSCWLTIEDSDHAKRALLLETDKEVMTIIACGYGKKERMLKRLDIVNPSSVTLNTRKGHIAPKIAQDDMVYHLTWNQPVDWTRLDTLLDRALYAASLAPSFLNRQPYRYVLGHHKLILCTKQEEMVSELDRRLDTGATMLHFDAVYESYQGERNQWKMGQPEDLWDLKMPEEYFVVAWYEL